MRKCTGISEPQIVSIRCVILDDNQAFLASARRLLTSEGFTVVGTASSAGDALRLASTLKPDVVLVDVEIGDESGFDVAQKFAALDPPVPTIMISMYPEADLSDLLAESPALGFVSKSELTGVAVTRLMER
jgi:DNA-binding NarL/FixJ family response regulator